MKKAIKGIAQTIGVVVAVSGVAVCMCDANGLDAQIATMFTGLGIFIVGVLICAVSNRGAENAIR